MFDDYKLWNRGIFGSEDGEGEENYGPGNWEFYEGVNGVKGVIKGVFEVDCFMKCSSMSMFIIDFCSFFDIFDTMFLESSYWNTYETTLIFSGNFQARNPFKVR